MCADCVDFARDLGKALLYNEKSGWYSSRDMRWPYCCYRALLKEHTMSRILPSLAISLALTAAVAQPSLPADFSEQTVDTPDGARIYARSGGAGPVVLLIHGFGDAGEMWAPVARELVKNHTVVIPDLRGMGRSSHPAGGYDKRTQAADLRAVMLALGHDRSAVVGHDIGNMVAYAYAARYPGKVERLIVNPSER
jgi:hypothetical protein